MKIFYITLFFLFVVINKKERFFLQKGFKSFFASKTAQKYLWNIPLKFGQDKCPQTPCLRRLRAKYLFST